MPAGNRGGALKAGFGFLLVRRILAQPQLAFEPMQLWLVINDAGLRDMVEGLRYHAQSLLAPAGIATGFRQQAEKVRGFELGPGRAIGNEAVAQLSDAFLGLPLLERRAGYVGAALATSQERRGLCPAAIGRTWDRQVASRRDPGRADRGEPHTRLRLYCSPHHQDSALYPTITRLERAAGFRRDDTADERLDKLERVLVEESNDFGEAAPLLAALLSLPTGERYPPLNLTPQKQKEKTLQALVAQVAVLAGRQPLLLLIEDAHWSDPTSLELLDLIIDRVSALRVLLIITFRHEFNPPWTDRPHVSQLALGRLAPRQRAEMIAGVTGGKALPGEITDQIVDRTDGVPLFVEELTKAVVESRMLTDAGDHYTAAGVHGSGPRMTPLAVPATLQASLLARLDRLAPAREVAQIGAVLGRQFSHELIVAVAGMPPRQLDDALAQLVGAELIYRRGTPPDAEYTFKHALVQDAAYGTLLRSRRQQLHARVAATLEGRFPEIVAAQPALLAHQTTNGFIT